MNFAGFETAENMNFKITALRLLKVNKFAVRSAPRPFEYNTYLRKR